MKKNLTYTVVGTFIALLLMVLVVIFTGLLATWNLSFRYNQVPVMGLLIWFIPSMIICFAILEGSVILSAPTRDIDSLKRKNESVQFSKRKVWKWAIGAIVLVLVVMLLCSNAYIACTDTGIHYRYIFETSTRTWDDVASYTFASNGAALTCTLKFKGGQSLTLTDYTVAETKCYSETFQDIFGYMAYLDDQLTGLGKFKTVSVSESFLSNYRNTEAWEIVARICDIKE